MRKIFLLSGLSLLMFFFCVLIFPSKVFGSDAECSVRDLGNNVAAGFGFLSNAWDCAGAYAGTPVDVYLGTSDDGGNTMTDPDSFYVNFGDNTGWQPGARTITHAWGSPGKYTMEMSFYYAGVHYTYSQVVRVASAQGSVSGPVILSAFAGNTASYTYSSGNCILGVVGSYLQGNDLTPPPTPDTNPPTQYTTTYAIDGTDFGRSRICPDGGCYGVYGWQSTGNICSRNNRSACTWRWPSDGNPSDNYGIVASSQHSITWKVSLSANAPAGEQAYWNITNIQTWEDSTCQTHPPPSDPPLGFTCTASFNPAGPFNIYGGYVDTQGRITSVGGANGSGLDFKWDYRWKPGGDLSSHFVYPQTVDPITTNQDYRGYWDSNGLNVGTYYLFLRGKNHDSGNWVECANSVRVNLNYYSPVGVFDSANCNQFVGWSGDPDRRGTPVNIHFTAKAAGIPLIDLGNSYVADVKRESGVCRQVCPACATSCDICDSCTQDTCPARCKHGFRVSTSDIPGFDALRDGNTYNIRAYGINLPGTGGTDTLLNRSPLQITCSVPPITPTPTSTPASTPTSTPQSTSTPTITPTPSSTPACIPPLDPSWNPATNINETWMTLNWDDNSDNETGFKIWTKEKVGGTYAADDDPDYTVGADIISQNLPQDTLQPCTTYNFKIVSYIDAIGECLTLTSNPIETEETTSCPTPTPTPTFVPTPTLVPVTGWIQAGGGDIHSDQTIVSGNPAGTFVSLLLDSYPGIITNGSGYNFVGGSASLKGWLISGYTFNGARIAAGSNKSLVCGASGCYTYFKTLRGDGNITALTPVSGEYHLTPANLATLTATASYSLVGNLYIGDTATDKLEFTRRTMQFLVDGNVYVKGQVYNLPPLSGAGTEVVIPEATAKTIEQGSDDASTNEGVDGNTLSVGGGDISGLRFSLDNTKGEVPAYQAKFSNAKLKLYLSSLSATDIQISAEENLDCSTYSAGDLPGRGTVIASHNFDVTGLPVGYHDFDVSDVMKDFVNQTGWTSDTLRHICFRVEATAGTIVFSSSEAGNGAKLYYTWSPDTVIPADGALMVVASGDINFSGDVWPGANSLISPVFEGAYIADGQLNTNSDPEVAGKRFTGRGVFVANDGIKTTRDLSAADKLLYSDEYFIYSPSLLAQFRNFLGKTQRFWVEVAP